MTPRKIKDDALENWITQDFLMRIKIEDDSYPFPGHTLRTVVPGLNDNPILFLCAFVCLLPPHLRWDLGLRAYAAIKRLEWGGNGAYSVAPGRFNNYNSHDNYTAISVLSVIYDFEFANQLAERGLKDAFTYELKYETDQFVGGIKKLTRKVHNTPSYQCFYLLMAGIRPTVFQFINFIGDLIISFFKKNGSSTQLKFVICTAMPFAVKKHAGKSFIMYYMIASVFCSLYLGFKDFRQAFQEYYKRDHPNRRLAEWRWIK